jgi:hypothetical protein
MFYYDDDVDGWYGWHMVFNAPFNNISFSYIVVVSFIGGGNILYVFGYGFATFAVNL